MTRSPSIGDTPMTWRMLSSPRKEPVLTILSPMLRQEGTQLPLILSAASGLRAVASRLLNFLSVLLPGA